MDESLHHAAAADTNPISHSTSFHAGRCATSTFAANLRPRHTPSAISLLFPPFYFFLSAILLLFDGALSTRPPQKKHAHKQTGRTQGRTGRGAAEGLRDLRGRPPRGAASESACTRGTSTSVRRHCGTHIAGLRTHAGQQGPGRHAAATLHVGRQRAAWRVTGARRPAGASMHAPATSGEGIRVSMLLLCMQATWKRSCTQPTGVGKRCVCFRLRDTACLRHLPACMPARCRWPPMQDDTRK